MSRTWGQEENGVSVGEACDFCSPMWNSSSDQGQIVLTSPMAFDMGIEGDIQGGRRRGPVIFDVWSSDLQQQYHPEDG